MELGSGSVSDTLYTVNGASGRWTSPGMIRYRLAHWHDPEAVIVLSKGSPNGSLDGVDRFEMPRNWEAA